MHEHLPPERLLARDERLREELQRVTRERDALAASKSQLDSLLEASPYIFYSAPFTAYGAISAVSPNITSILGYTPDEVVADPDFWRSRIHPDDPAPAVTAKRLPISGRHTAEYRFRHADGSWRVLRDAMTLSAGDGETATITGTITDITDDVALAPKPSAPCSQDAPCSAPRDAAGECHFALSLARLEDLLSSAPFILYCVLNTDGFPGLYVSPSITDILGYTVEEATGSTEFFLQHMHPDDLGVIDVEDVLQSLGHHMVEYRFRHADGTWRWIRDDMVLTTTADGEKRIVGLMMDITPQREAAVRMKRHDSFFKAIFDSSPSGILITNKDSFIIDANRKAAEIFGYTKGELLGKHPDDLTHPDDYAITREMIDSMDSVNASCTLEKRYIHKNGQPFWADVRVSAIYTASGTKEYAIVTINDVTERIHAQQRLRRTEEEKHTILSTISEIVIRHDLSHTVLWGNEAATRSLNLTQDDLASRKCYELWHNRTAPCEGCPVREAIDTGDPIAREMATPDGHVWFVTGYPVFDAQGAVIGAIEVARNITEQKFAAEALRRSESEKQLILSTITETVVHQTADRRIIWANSAAADAAGRELDDMVNNACHRIFTGRDTPCPGCPVERVLETGTTMRNEVTHADGSIWEVQYYALRTGEDEHGSILKVSREITENKRIEDNLRRARDLAQDASTMKTEFLANMSHELRSPLNGVLGMLDVLLDTELDYEQRDCVETALQAGEGLLTIINDILDFSKLQADMITLSHNEFNLRRTIRMVINTFAQQSKRQGLTIGYTVDDSIPKMIIGDEGRMRQILFNLVGNAVKFTKKGSVRVDVQMLRKATAPGSARLLFTVTDTGIGIPEDKLETIFDPFIQLNWGKSRKYEGTGLGLGIVRRLVSRMGGIITVDSCVNKGTTVDFWVNIALPQNTTPSL
ncbi:PAS domain S-box protein [Desulfobaculum sp. SPO524]|uniref:PAS domain S-box protein n=1 Tax=Desulfobaculum sp. SPO524 TaxID=3378071 RepID=UPI003852350A